MAFRRVLIVSVLVAAVEANVLPPLAARQSSSICGTVPEFPVGDKIEILAWSDLTTSYGYLSASPANVPFWGQSTGYGVTSDPAEALTGIFTCGDQGFANWPPALLGAANAQSVPGTTINAIGLIDPFYASGGDPTVNVRGSSNWIAFGATFVGEALSTPASNTDITYDGSPAVYESVVWTLDHLPAADGTRVNILQPVWTNPNNGNGGNIDVPLFLSPSQGVVVAISDPAAFEFEYASAGPWLQVVTALIN
ncbi:hypothetical protein PsYK624_142080 [Phanerochaete sordida]|uniref:Uncharacterized protein n=1 Tax=Phanerochaete sordida TaxID=48140 RepID=A0A9P3GN05_9APHY|nr:hypothetical protein PsYK624_142080 [Phanerochaete sordida]